MLRVVLDTNQLVSALLNPEGPAFEIIKAAGLQGEKKFDIVLSEDILAEFQNVLSYPRIKRLHGWSEQKIKIFITLLKEIAIFERCAVEERVVSDDPHDDKFFHLAVSGDARYIISRDTHLLKIKEFKGVTVLLPEVFLSALRKREL